MNFVVPKEHANTMDGLTVEITDEDIQDSVGEIRFQKGANRHISMFGGKYTWTARNHDECVGFVKGVESVLKYINE
jgi:hypothetical protein